MSQYLGLIWCIYLLPLCMLGKNFSRRHFETFFLFFLENGIRHFMPTVSLGDNLHEVSDPLPRKRDQTSVRSSFLGINKKNITNLLSAEKIGSDTS